MSEIKLTRHHKLGLKKGKAAAQKVADELAKHFDMKSEWDGHELHFSRSGVKGVLEITKDSVAVHAKLGILLSAFKPRIEHQISENFEKYFS